ncbi:MAG: ABC transporter permease [Acidimicrobiia bacterium]
MRVVLRRLLSAIPTLLLVLLLAMLLLEATPGDPARVIAGDAASDEDVAVVRERLGLDEPLVGRYLDYARGAVVGDLGESFRDGQPVASSIARTLPVTASLGIVSLLLAVAFAVPAGVVAAVRRNGLVDRALTAVGAIFVAVPPFVVALVLVVLFSIDRNWLPATGYVKLSDDPLEWLRHIALPCVALALPSAAELARQLRGSMVDVLQEDYINTQFAKGLRRRAIIGKHVAKNAAAPVVTVLGVQAGRILGGVVIIESLFVIPGFGNLVYLAVLGRDFPVVQGAVLVSALVVVVVNLLVDLSYLYFDPKLRSDGS